MSEIGTLSLERLNNGAHFLFISNVLARAEVDANVNCEQVQLQCIACLCVNSDSSAMQEIPMSLVSR